MLRASDLTQSKPTLNPELAQRASLTTIRFLSQQIQDCARNHQVDLNSVISELCTSAFSNSDSKKQFELWLDDAFPSTGEAEDKAMSANEDISEGEEEKEGEPKNIETIIRTEMDA